MNRFHSVLRTLAFVLATSGPAALALSPAQAAVPSPTTSTCPAAVFLTSDGACCFDVIVRDIAGNPAPGSTVNVDFGDCRVTLCPVQPPGVTIQGNGVNAFTDAAGVAHICICGTIKGQCDATIRADGILLCAIPVKKKCN